MINRRQTLGLLGAASTILALPAIRTAQAATTTLRIGWQKNGVLALAKRTGALEKRLAARGVTVTWAEFTSGPPLLEALGAGALDFGPTGDVPPLFAQAAGGNLAMSARTREHPPAPLFSFTRMRRSSLLPISRERSLPSSVVRALIISWSRR